MKRIKKFNEAVIDYKSDNIVNFYNELKDKLSQRRMIFFQDVVESGDKYGVEVVDYDTFYNQLNQIDRQTAPPRHGVPVFALANDETMKPQVVFTDMFTNPRRPAPIDLRLINHVYHMLKHENIHLKQHSKRPGYRKPMPDPKDRGKYFSDTDEIMAFAQSITDMIINDIPKPKTIKEAISKMKNNPLYKDVKNRVSDEVLKKYHKYIYLYLEKEFTPEEIKESNDTPWATPNRLGDEKLERV
jgi:hypothetical protein